MMNAPSAPFSRMSLSRGVVSALLEAHAAAVSDPREELVGGLVVVGPASSRSVSYDIVSVPSCENRHPDPSEGFRPEPRDVRAILTEARAAKRQVLGLWIAHRTEAPYPTDADRQAIEPFLGSIEVPVTVLVGPGSGRTPVVRAFAWTNRDAREIQLLR